LSEYLEPRAAFDHHKVEDTIVFMGSARIKSREAAEEMLARRRGEGPGTRADGAQDVRLLRSGPRARSRLTKWSKELDRVERRFVACAPAAARDHGAANRGAAEAKGLNVGLTISLPGGRIRQLVEARAASNTMTCFECCSSLRIEK